MKHTLLALGITALVLGSASPSLATSLRIKPVLIEAAAEQKATQIEVHNLDSEAVDLQFRVFRWSQGGGAEHLAATRDVVVSPPLATLSPGARQTVRIIRRTGAPLAGEESYRILVDEIPNLRRGQGKQVNFALRHSLPVFFGSGRGDPDQVSWSIRKDADGLWIAANNRSDRRVRISDVEIIDAAGRRLAVRAGLVGYVLAGAAADWRLDAFDVNQAITGSQITIKAALESGPVHGIATLQAH